MQNTNQKAVVKMARIVDVNELAERQQEAVNKLMEGHYIDTLSGGYYSHPASVTESFNNVDSFLDYVADQAVAGTERYPHIFPILNPTCMQITYYKPKEELDVLIQEVKEKAKADYLASIEAWNAEQINLLTSQLYQQAKAKEEKVIADKEAKALAAAKAEAEKFIQSQITEGK